VLNNFLYATADHELIGALSQSMMDTLRRRRS